MENLPFSLSPASVFREISSVFYPALKLRQRTEMQELAQ